MYFGQKWSYFKSGQKRAGRWTPYETRREAVRDGCELVSVLKLCISVEDFRNWEQEQWRQGLNPKKVQIRAPFSGPFFADIDAARGEEEARQRALVNALRGIYQKHHLDPEAIRLWFSGSKGFHLMIPTTVLGHRLIHPDLAIIYKVLAHHLGLGELMDISVYKRSRGSLWRVTGKKRDNGRHKIPITWQELERTSFADLYELAKTPRHDFEFPAYQSASPQLHALLKKTASDLLGEPTKVEHEPKSEPEFPKMIGIEPPTIRASRVYHLEILIWSLPKRFADHYEHWLKVGMALHYELDGGRDGQEIWNTWSKQSRKYNARSITRKWRSFHPNPQNPVTISTIVDWALMDHVA